MITELGSNSLQSGNNDCFTGRVKYPPLRMFLLHRLAQLSDDTNAPLTLQSNLNKQTPLRGSFSKTLAGILRKLCFAV